jgi:threonine/homoserine/homoserine lactone efflux protein
MEIAGLGQGLIWGITLAGAIGPICLLCIQRSLEKGFWYGVVSALGVASVDAFYGAVAGFGLSILSDFLLSVQIWVRLFGGLVLLYLGVKALLAQPSSKQLEERASNLLGAYGSIVVLTMTNPLTIIVFLGLFASSGIRSESGYVVVLLTVLGVFLGSFGVTGSLTGVMGVLRRKFSPVVVLWLNRCSGGLILLFGLWSLLGLVWK